MISILLFAWKITNCFFSPLVLAFIYRNLWNVKDTIKLNYQLFSFIQSENKYRKLYKVNDFKIKHKDKMASWITLSKWMNHKFSNFSNQTCSPSHFQFKMRYLTSDSHVWFLGCLWNWSLRPQLTKSKYLAASQQDADSFF